MFDSENKDKLLVLLCCCCKGAWKNTYAAMLGIIEGSQRDQADMVQRSMMVLHPSDKISTEERIRRFIFRMRISGFRHRSKQRFSPFQYSPEDNSPVEPAPSKATKNNIWLFVFHWRGRDHWVGIPREVAKRSLLLGYLPVAPWTPPTGWSTFWRSSST